MQQVMDAEMHEEQQVFHKFAHLNIKISGLSLFVAYHFLVQTTKHVSSGRNLMVYQ